MPKHFYLFETKKYIPKQNSVKKTNIQTKKTPTPTTKIQQFYYDKLKQTTTISVSLVVA